MMFKMVRWVLSTLKGGGRMEGVEKWGGACKKEEEGELGEK